MFKVVRVRSDNAYQSVGYHFQVTVPFKYARFRNRRTVHLTDDMPVDLTYSSDVFRLVPETQVTLGVCKDYFLVTAVHKICDLAEKVFMEAFKRKFQKNIIGTFYTELFKIRIRGQGRIKVHLGSKRKVGHSADGFRSFAKSFI